MDGWLSSLLQAHHPTADMEKKQTGAVKKPVYDAI